MAAPIRKLLLALLPLGLPAALGLALCPPGYDSASPNPCAAPLPPVGPFLGNPGCGLPVYDNRGDHSVLSLDLAGRGRSFRDGGRREFPGQVVYFDISYFPSGAYGTVGLGTPSICNVVLLDTDADHTWMLDSAAAAQSCRAAEKQHGAEWETCGLAYNRLESMTSRLVSRQGFHLSYWDGQDVRGDLVEDSLTVDSRKMPSWRFGAADTITSIQGRLGLGVGSGSDSVLDNLEYNDYIRRNAFSMFPCPSDDPEEARRVGGDSDAVILFGAIDTGRFLGSLGMIPLLPGTFGRSGWTDSDGDIRHYAVPLAGIDVKSVGHRDEVKSARISGVLPVPAVLASAFPYILVPDLAARNIWHAFNLPVWRSNFTFGADIAFVDCAAAQTDGDMYAITIVLGGEDGGQRKEVVIPVSKLVLPVHVIGIMVERHLGSGMAANDRRAFIRALLAGVRRVTGIEDLCLFGVMPTRVFFPHTFDNFAVLGVPFFKAAYLLFDQEGEEVGVAQANPNPATSNRNDGDNNDDDDDDRRGRGGRRGRIVPLGAGRIRGIARVNGVRSVDKSEEGGSHTAVEMRDVQGWAVRREKKEPEAVGQVGDL